jgi:hypothetical protein
MRSSWYFPRKKRQGKEQCLLTDKLLSTKAGKIRIYILISSSNICLKQLWSQQKTTVNFFEGGVGTEQMGGWGNGEFVLCSFRLTSVCNNVNVLNFFWTLKQKVPLSPKLPFACIRAYLPLWAHGGEGWKELYTLPAPMKTKPLRISLCEQLFRYKNQQKFPENIFNNCFWFIKD